jgi:ATP-dependent DNA helicase PIF1
LITKKNKDGDIHKYNHKIRLQRNGNPVDNTQTIKIAEDQSKNLPVQNPTVLCVGCQVMLLINLDCEKGLVNGSRGVVIGFDSSGGNFPIVEFVSGEKITIEAYDWKIKMDFGVEAVVTQIPLALAWAVTIHKSQGASVDLAEIDVGSNIFEYGQAYVALSRVRSISGLRLLRFDPSSIKANPKVKLFYKQIEDKDKSEV